MTEFDGLPVLRNPVAIAAFEGWNDAADASTAAVEHLEQVWTARPVTALDPEEFYDFQVNRPIVAMAEGQTLSIDWPTTRFCLPGLNQSPDEKRSLAATRSGARDPRSAARRG